MNWIIGDIHGCLEQFDSVLAKIKERDSEAQIYCVGDYCDRGPNTRGVVDRILAEGNIKCVRGNHDDVFDCIISCKPTQLSDNQGSDAPMENLAWFLNFGMYETLASYGIYHDDVREALRTMTNMRAMAARIPESHAKFFNELPLMIEEKDFFVAHAAVVPESDLKSILEYDTHRKAMIWGRYDLQQIKSNKEWGKTGYFGHTPTHFYGEKGIVSGPNIELIDTGCVFGNCLTAVCHETKEIITS